MKKSNIGPRINFLMNQSVDADSDNVEKEQPLDKGLASGSRSITSSVEDRPKGHPINSRQRDPKSVKFEPDVVVCVFNPCLEVLSIEKTIQYHSSREIQMGMIKNIRNYEQQTKDEKKLRSILKKCRDTKSSYSSYEQSSSY